MQLLGIPGVDVGEAVFQVLLDCRCQRRMKLVQVNAGYQTSLSFDDSAIEFACDIGVRKAGFNIFSLSTDFINIEINVI